MNSHSSSLAQETIRAYIFVYRECTAISKDRMAPLDGCSDIRHVMERVVPINEVEGGGSVLLERVFAVEDSFVGNTSLGGLVLGNANSIRREVIANNRTSTAPALTRAISFTPIPQPTEIPRLRGVLTFDFMSSWMPAAGPLIGLPPVRKIVVAARSSV